MEFETSPTIDYDCRVRDAKVKFRATLGRFDLDTPPDIVEAAIVSLNKGGKNHHYASPASSPELVETLREYVEGWAGFKPEYVIPSPAKYAVFSVLFILSKLHGSRVAVRDLHWPTYREQAKMAGADFVPLPCDADNGFEIGEEYEEGLKGLHENDALIVNSPHNPTGLVLKEKEKKIVTGHGGFVVSDEVYHELDHSGRKSFAQSVDPEKLVIIDSLSKSFSMDGWRLGYVATNSKEIALSFKKMRSQVLTSIPLFLQSAMNTAVGLKPELRERKEICHERLEVLMAGFKLMAEALEEKGNGLELSLPDSEGAFYLFPQLREGGKPLEKERTEEFFCTLLKHGIGVTPGHCFGVPGPDNKGKGCMRISYSDLNEEELPEFLTRFADALGGKGYADTDLGLKEKFAELELPSP